MASKHRPQRSCVVCRVKKDKRALTRLVLIDERLQVDVTGKAKGRGAYLCADPGCWMAAHASMGRALRRDLSDDDREYLRQMKPA